jgi:effector-binding domain-containing protein
MTTIEAQLVVRPEQPYAAIRKQVSRAELATVLPPLFSEIFDWLTPQGVGPAGPPFYRYVAMNADDRYEVEVGIPIDGAAAGNENVRLGVLPAGTYAVHIHFGPYHELRDATAALHQWARENGVEFQKTADGKQMEVQIESYLTDPTSEPDSRKWQTEIALLTAPASS